MGSAAAQVFAFLNDSAFVKRDATGNLTTTINFTGQSLGGALAQYAAYEWVQLHSGDANQINLTTFNGLGGIYGLNKNEDNFTLTVLAGINSAANYVIPGDIVSRAWWRVCHWANLSAHRFRFYSNESDHRSPLYRYAGTS